MPTQKTTSLLLKAIPEDAYNILLKKQLEYTLIKGRKINLEETILRIIRDSE